MGVSNAKKNYVTDSRNRPSRLIFRAQTLMSLRERLPTPLSHKVVNVCAEATDHFDHIKSRLMSGEAN
jgi:hypothetical protein